MGEKKRSKSIRGAGVDLIGRTLPLGITMLLQSACGTLQGAAFQPPEHGGPSWSEILSPHFVMYTDLPPDEGSTSLAHFERIHDAFEKVAFPADNPPAVRTTLVLLRNQDEYEQIGPKGSDGYFSEKNLIDEERAIMVFHGDLSDTLRSTFQHELTHRFVYYFYPNAPVWLNEGLAEYFSSLSFERDKIVLGRPLAEKGFIKGSWAFKRVTPSFTRIFVPISRVPPLKDVLGLSYEAFYANREAEPGEEMDKGRQTAINYISAWSAVHMLQNDPLYKNAFSQYLMKLSTSKPGDAWKAAFGDIDPALMEKHFRAFVSGERIFLVPVPYQLPPPPRLLIRPLSLAETRWIWAALRPREPEENRALMRADLDMALYYEPRFLPARLLRLKLNIAEGNKAQAQEDIDAIRKIDPRYPGLNAFLLKTYIQQIRKNPKDSELERNADGVAAILAQYASTSWQLNIAAWYLAKRNRTAEALPLAARAVKLNYSCYDCYDTLALALFQSGDIQKAVEAQELALSRMEEGILNRDEYVERLARYRKAAETLNKTNAEEPLPQTPAGDLDRAQTVQAISKARKDVGRCRKPDGPVGPGKVIIVFAPSGKVIDVELTEAPYAGTLVGECITGIFADIEIPPFEGSPMRVNAAFEME